MSERKNSGRFSSVFDFIQVFLPTKKNSPRKDYLKNSTAGIFLTFACFSFILGVLALPSDAYAVEAYRWSDLTSDLRAGPGGGDTGATYWDCDANKTQCTQYVRQELVNERGESLGAESVPTGLTASCRIEESLVSASTICTTTDANTGESATVRETSDLFGDAVDTTYRDEGGNVVDQERETANALDWLGNITIGLVSAIVWFVTEILIWIMGGLLALVGWLFDAVVTEFVIEMGKYTTSPDALAVKTAWILIRDLANIGIIGGLIATAVGTIIGSGNYSVSKTLARLILAAVLVNFSYFFAGAIIDFSNFTAKAAYERVVNGANCESRSGGCKGIATRLAGILRLSENRDELRSATRAREVNAQQQAGGSSAGTESRYQESFSIARKATFNVMMLIFYIVTIFVFLSAISLLIARFIALIFILVTSPIGIAGSAVPLIKTYSEEWWKELWAQTMFAPVYLLLAGISLNILEGFANGITFNVGRGLGVSETIENVIGIMAMFVVAIGFMWTALSTAKKMSQGTGRFKELYDGVQKYMTGPAGQVVLGGGAERVFEYYNRLMGADFSGKPKSFLGGVGKYVGGGVQGLLKRTPAGRLGELALKGVANQKFGGEKGESYIEARDRRLARASSLNLIGEREKAKSKLLDPKEVDKLKAAEKAYLDEQKPDLREDLYNKYLQEKAAFEQLLTDMPPEGFEDMKKREPRAFIRLAPYLSSAQFKSLSHDAKIPKTIRNEMKDARFKNVTDLLNLQKARAKGEGYNEHKLAGETLDQYKARYSRVGGVKGDGYKEIQGQLFNLFKYGGISKEDVPAMMQHHHDLLEDEVLLDGGMTHGSKMAILNSGELGEAQKEIAKRTWQTGVRERLANTGIPIVSIEENPFKGMTTVDINNAIAAAGGQWDEAVKGMVDYFEGKQPQEVSGQVHDNDLLSPAFAAAASIDAISDLPGNKDPVYLQALADNLVQILKSDYGNADPARKARLQSVLNYMQNNSRGFSAYGSFIENALSKAGATSKALLQGYNP